MHWKPLDLILVLGNNLINCKMVSCSVSQKEKVRSRQPLYISYETKFIFKQLYAYYKYFTVRLRHKSTVGIYTSRHRKLIL
jgi:hypothetical protein